MSRAFTIIIPTHERHEILRRSIDYYKNFNCNVLIADSSLKPMKYYFPDNFTYMHLPDLSYVKKILKSAETVTTPYVCITGDDDYFLEHGLQEGSSFLDANLDFVSVQGRYLKFELIDNQVVFSPKYDSQVSSYSVTDDDIFSRVVSAYNPYMAHFASIQRTNVFVKSWRVFSDLSTPFISELATMLLPMCYGKHKVIPVLWMARDAFMFPRPACRKTIDPAKSKYVLISTYRAHKQSIDEVKLFLDSKESRLLKKNFIDEVSNLVGSDKKGEEIFNAAFESYVSWVVKNRNKCMEKIIIKTLVPNWIINYIRTYRSLQHMGGVETTSLAKDNLNKIELSVLAFLKIYETVGRREILNLKSIDN
jgi:glycosyltransferase domain-containing protein